MTRLLLVCGAVALITLMGLGAHSIAYADAWGPQDEPTLFNAALNLSGGMPAPDGQYTVSFSLWDQQNAGMMLWTETKIVQVTGGVFTTSLGTQTPIGIDVLTGTDPGDSRWLEVQLDGDTPMPRFQLHSTPYAGVSSRIRGDVSTNPGYLRLATSEPGAEASLDIGYESGAFKIGFTRFNPDGFPTRARFMDYTEDIYMFVNGQSVDTVSNYGSQGGFVKDTGSGAYMLWGAEGFPYGPLGGFGLRLRNAAGDSVALVSTQGMFLESDVILHEYGHGLTWRMKGTDDTILQLGGQELGNAFIKLSNPTTGDIATHSWDGTSMATPHVSGVAAAYANSRGTLFVEESTNDTLAAYGNQHMTMRDSSTGATMFTGTNPGIGSTCNLYTAFVTSGGDTILHLGGQELGDAFIEIEDPSTGAVLSLTSGVVNAHTPPFDLSVFLTGNDLRFEDAGGDTILRLGGQELGDAFIHLATPVGQEWLSSPAGQTWWNEQSGDTSVSLSGSGFAFGTLSRAHGLRSFAGGHRAKAEHGGSFVWADGANNDLSTSGVDQVLMRASGGYTLFSNGLKTAGVSLAPGGNQWDMISDSASKINVRTVDGDELLAKIAELQISRWSYKSEGETIDHIGPMAQDFYEAFGLGRGETTISSLDPSGVALAAIKALYESQKAENEHLRKQIAELRELLDRQTK